MSQARKCTKCGKPIENKGHKIEIKSAYGGGILYMCDNCYADYKRYRKRVYGR